MLLIARRLVQLSCLSGLPETRHGPSTPPAKTETRTVEHTQLIAWYAFLGRSSSLVVAGAGKVHPQPSPHRSRVFP
jgi:hypothetical protein